MGSSVCTSKNKDQVIIPISTSQNNEDLSDEEEVIPNKPQNESQIVLDLYIKCTNLTSVNRFQLPNTIAYIYIQEQSEFIIQAETDVQTSTVTPLFQRSLKINYSLGTNYKIKIEILEISSKKDAKFLLGSNIYDLHEIATRTDMVTKELEVSGKRNGNIQVWVKELKNINGSVTMQWEFDSKIFTKGYYLLRLSRPNGPRQLIIYQSECKKPPVFWEKFEVTAHRLCQGNEEKTLTAEIIDMESDMSVIASAKFNLKQLKKDTKLRISTSSNQVTNGELKLSKFSYTSARSFISLVRLGIKIHPFYVIDFSEKINHNENVSENPYLRCIQSLQGTLQFYSQDPLFTVLGTGCYFAGIDSASYCFALNGNIFQPEIMANTLEAYYFTTLRNISASNQTKFSEVLDTAIKFIQHESQESQKYYALFIISPSEPLDLIAISEKCSLFKNLPLSAFVMKVEHPFPQYESAKKFFPNETREFFSIFDVLDSQQALETLQEHILDYSKNFEFEGLEKTGNFRHRTNSIIKNFSEKIRTRSNFFTKTKVDYIEHLTKTGYPSDKIEEVSLIGVPFLIVGENSDTRLPVRTRTKVMNIRQKSVRPTDMVCVKCNKAVFILAESKCGCKIFCYECVGNSECLNCSKLLV